MKKVFNFFILLFLFIVLSSDGLAMESDLSGDDFSCEVEQKSFDGIVVEDDEIAPDSLKRRKNNPAKDTAPAAIGQAPDDESEYDSDSEDENPYIYHVEGDRVFQFPQDYEGKICMVFYRGIHFIKNKFNKDQRSQIRRQFNPGRAVYSSAALDLIGLNQVEYDLADAEQCEEMVDELEISKTPGQDAPAQEVWCQVVGLGLPELTVSEDDVAFGLDTRRHIFQQIYTNHQDQFRDKLKSKVAPFEDFTSSKNPQVSTSETFRHAGRYAFGKKYLGKDSKKLDPGYDINGRPKYPYLGKIYVIIISTDEISNRSPYFVVYAHKKHLIDVQTNFHNNILAEREVSFPGWIPGKYIVYEQAVRVPSFAGDYKLYFLEKYGMGQGNFYNLKRNLTGSNKSAAVENIIRKTIAHISERLEYRIKKECKKKGITIVYKGLDGGYSEKPIEIPKKVVVRKHSPPCVFDKFIAQGHSQKH